MFVCVQCRSYVHEQHEAEETSTSSLMMIQGPPVCQVCGNVWDNERGLQEAIQDACRPYGGLSASSHNHVALPITVSMAGNIRIRLSHFPSATPVTPATSRTTTEAHRAMLFLQDIKRQLQQQAERFILASRADQDSKDEETERMDPHRHSTSGKSTTMIHSEQQGYLSIHILCIPSKPPPDMSPSEASQCGPNPPKKRKRHFKHHQHQHQQQQAGGSNSTGGSGGGDPRILLEERLKAQGYLWWSWSEAETVINTATSSTSSMTTSTTTTSPWTLPLEFHIAVHRTPIFFYGYYTKSLRTVSQTPFMVAQPQYGIKKEEEEEEEEDAANQSRRSSPSGPTKSMMVTLGTTSVEEQICEPIIRRFGVSPQNTNLPHPNYNNNNNSNNNNNIITTFGQCKFHASGREDMDVRMILRPSSSSSSSSVGRPFCVQLIDALRPVVSEQELQKIVHEINHTTDSDDCPRTETSETGNDDDNTKNNLLSPLWYGRNPMGVGISNDFQIVPAVTFSNLQADTESKVKHYGCHCWSQRELPADWTFSLSTVDTNGDSPHPRSSRPLTIQQQTPLRVLHRRANLTRERQILEARASRIDAHHFRLQLSTQAGTYVKEFVHGDLGRTKPSMASLLNTKTNLLLLDCEGIEMNNDHSIISSGGDGEM